MAWYGGGPGLARERGGIDHERMAQMPGHGHEMPPDDASGSSHTVCTTYLVPAAAKDVLVPWSEDDGGPSIWTFPTG
ncbi:hypothetical protein [Streptomyces corynorhini]|uniref:hypothetical protein n=1 Tax=Streptomyces corynorhini TaxID=2282652 RepID=UPI0018F31502|nr:hypothetical protein [Streptomyces corynorhini]